MDHGYYSQMFVDDENMDDQLDQVEKDMEKGSDELLIDAVRAYPHLYNTSLKEYKDTQMKENSWTEISLLMKMSVASCQNHWLRLCERFNKEQRLQEAESRSGSGASRRSVYALYKNMSFLGNHIKRRKTYTNITNLAINNGTNNMPDFSFDEHNSTKNCAPQQFISNSKELFNFLSNPISSGSASHADSNVMPEQLEVRPDTNFSCEPHTQKINRLQTEQNSPICTRIPQELNRFETRSESSSLPPLRNESRNSSYMSQEIASPSISRDCTPSPALQTIRTMRDNTGKIKNRSSTHLESSLATLSDTLLSQNRIANRLPTPTEQTAWNLNNLTPDKSFGLLVATELERLSEIEKYNGSKQ